MLAEQASGVSVLRLSPSGRLSACLLSVGAAMLAEGWHAAAVCLVVVVTSAICCRAALDPLRRIWLWLFIVFLIIPSSLLGEPGRWMVWGIVISSEGLADGLQMALRTIAVLVAITGFSASVSIGQLAGLLERVGFKGLGFALGVAVNMLPTVQEMATTSFHALRLRGGLRRHRLQTLRLLMITIVVNSLRHADDIVCAAEARAFSLDHGHAAKWEWHRGDALFAVALSVVLAVILLA